jgi:hypothetical protein
MEISWFGNQHICWLPYQEIYVTGNAPYDTSTGIHTSTVSLAGNVGDILATRHVGDVSKSCQIWVDMRVGVNTKSTPTQDFCIGNHRQIVDTVVRTDTVVHTPWGGNTVGKLNKSKSSGHVNILRLVRRWYTGGAAAVANFFGSR